VSRVPRPDFRRDREGSHPESLKRLTDPRQRCSSPAYTSGSGDNSCRSAPERPAERNARTTQAALYLVMSRSGVRIPSPALGSCDLETSCGLLAERSPCAAVLGVQTVGLARTSLTVLRSHEVVDWSTRDADERSKVDRKRAHPAWRDWNEARA
jgi:hypothetical protein